MTLNGQTSAERMLAPDIEAAVMGRGSRSRLKRGPYGIPAVRSTVGHGRPSCVLAENIRCYRILRGVTQDQLAVRMTARGHGWSRSIVSAVEGSKRSVTIDELFGLAISFGVTVGRLLDPSGPDGSRDLGLDVGLGADGHSSPLPNQLARVFAASRAAIRVVDEDTGEIEIDLTSDDMGTNVGAPVRKRPRTHPEA